LPLSVLEAMASGLPVVVSDIDGLKDVVQAGVNGMLAAPDDVDGLARVLSRLYQERALARRLGDSGRRIAREKYSFAKCLSATQELLSRSAIRASVRGGVTG
jgi:glycosyltransferase involved in cell wall biosynthesis